MVIGKEKVMPNIRIKVRDGAGEIKDLHYFKEEQLPPHCSHFVPMVFKKNCGIGIHTHEDNVEVYYILQGEARYNDNGREYVLKTGDVSVTYIGEFHAIHNEKDEELIVLAAGWTKN